MSYLDPFQLAALGFAHVGEGVQVSELARFYRPSQIWIGEGARIDDFTILSAGAGGIELGRFVHIACYSSLIGDGRISLEDFSGISSRVAIYSSSDTFSGEALAHPTIPAEYRAPHSADVILRQHALVGAGAVILPGVTMGVGSALGALSLAKSDISDFEIHAGVPARKISMRDRRLLELAEEFGRQRRLHPSLGVGPERESS